MASSFRESPQAAARQNARQAIRGGNAFELLATLEDRSVDLICTSPPYWGLRTYGFEDRSTTILERWRKLRKKPESGVPSWDWYQASGGALGMEPYPEWYVAHLAEFFGRARRVLKPGGSVWLNIGDTYFARWSSIRSDGRQGLGKEERHRRRAPAGGFRQDKQLLLIPSRVAIALQDDKWILRNDLIWQKPSAVPRPERDRLRLTHEHFFHFVQRNSRGRPKYYYDLTKAEQANADVVEVAPTRGRGTHSATFPAALVRPRIESSCPPDGLVLDPFCGTGTAVSVALDSGRQAIGFELSKHYLATARQVVEEVLLARGND